MSVDYSRFLEPFERDLFKNHEKEFFEQYGPTFDIVGGKLYADGNHFLFELLQNAEDAKATKINFFLFPDRLDIYHNGREFSDADVRSIRNIGKSSKKSAEAEAKIGKFGIGFKSVYSITDLPEIYSGEYHFHIRKYILPEEIPNKAIPQPWTTLFSLPFKQKEKELIYESLAKGLRMFDTRCLLFLNSLNEFSYNIGAEINTYKSEVKPLSDNLNQVFLVGGREEQSFIRVQKEQGAKKIALAFSYQIQTKDKQASLARAADTKLFVWFPTDKETKLHFLLNGNFNTTPPRDNIPEGDDHNKALINMAAELLVQIFPAIKKLGICNLAFLQALPIEAENFPEGSFYYPIFAKVKEALKAGDYLPTHKGGFTCGDNAVLAGTREMPEIYQPEGEVWLSTAITQDKTPQLWEYFTKTLWIDNIDPEKFATRITETFLQAQSDEWFIRFYEFLSGQKALWREKSYSQKAGILRTKPIIRLQDNELVAPAPDKIFLPKDGLNDTHLIVKADIAANEEALSFLRALGLHQPDEVNIISRTILPKYEAAPSVGDAEYEADLKQILGVLTGESIDAKTKLQKLIAPLNLVRCEDGLFRKLSETYCPSNLLKEWFAYSSNIHFADNSLPEAEWIGLGVANLPRRLKLNALPEEVIFKEPANQRRTPEDYDLEGLSDFLNNITSYKAKIFAAILPIFYLYDKDLFDGKLEYCYHSWYNFSFKNTIYQKIIQTACILGKDGALHKPCDIKIADISEDCARIGELPLNFKPTEKTTEERFAELGFIRKEDFDASEARASAAEARASAAEAKLAKYEPKPDTIESKRTEDDWQPECSPEETVLEKVEADGIPFYEKNPRIRLASGKDTDENIQSDEQPITEAPKPSAKKAKAIGQWAEDAVKKHLLEEEGYSEAEIRTLNQDGNIGTGRDFEILRNGEILKLIEVKSTESLTDHSFKASGHQWEVARKNADKYWIYAVFGAGSKNSELVKIQNPIKAWKEGRLQADPVNFVIRKKD